MRRLTLAVALAASALACGKGGKKGPFVAEGEGFAITAEEFKARIDEQSPFIRSRYTTLERKKEFLDNLIRFEVLAREAERRGLDKDPEVLLTARRVMVNKLVQKTFADGQDASKAFSDAELQAQYEQHRDDYVKPLRLRVFQILVKAPEKGPERAKAQGQARKLADKIRTDEKKAPTAFVTTAREKSEDEVTKASGGDLGFKSREELEKVVGKDAADKVFALKDGEIAGPLDSPRGFLILKLSGRQEAIDRPFEQVKTAIAQRMQRERKTKEFEEFQKKLREGAKVTVNDAELEKVAVQGAAPGPAGMPGLVRPMAPPTPAPAPPASQPK